MIGGKASPVAWKTLSRVLVPFQPSRRSIAFASRAVAASVLALGAVLALGYKEIAWAPITVWVLALPRRSMVLTKSLYRVLGTLIGAGMAFLMLPLESQPLLFMLLMSAWVALCAGTANLFRNYQAYVAQLAGFTAPIVAVLVYGHLGSIQEIAKERVVCVLLGIAASAVVTLLFSKRIQPRDVEIEARALAKQGVAWSAKVLEKTSPEPLAYNHGLLAQIADLNSFCENAAIESSAIRQRLGAIRRLVSAVLALVSSTRAVERLNAPADLERRGKAVRLLRAAAELIGKDDIPSGQAIAFRHLMPTDAVADDPAHAVETAWKRDRLEEIADGLDRIAAELDVIRTGPKTRHSAPPLVFHRDWAKAFSTGWRTLLACLVTGGLWIGLGWHGGAVAFIFTALATSIFGNHPLPTAGMRRFSIGVSAAAITFILWKALPFSATAGFSTTLGVVIALTFLGAIALANNVQPGMDYNANVSQLMLGPSAAATGAVAALFSGLDLLAGLGIAYAAFAWTADREARRGARLATSILADTRRLAQGRWQPHRHKWEATLYDRLYQSGLASAGSKACGDGLRHCLLGLDMGLEILRLRGLLGADSLNSSERPIVQDALRLLGGEIPDSQPLPFLELDALATRLTAESPGAATSSRYQAIGAMLAISRCLEQWRTPEPAGASHA
ncbi:FUSC family protein [Luteolibacter ambystomatis]|uniref:FUSC family protein n=1 Tax=Luteolibacter ambystomatis TaxID=2824561 RepID=A0A975IZJ6_9BACT|nr:FUSC family protein [Luteolibacter ambystomatis]QUE51362.1 FUSC family protein [Luteolibacter ambystomatis]